MADHLEIEQKFDVDEGFVRPDFGGRIDGVAAAEPVTYHLAATYFDTPEQRLAANKITLRRRTGGTDQGWHLKLPAGEGARRELQAPLGDPGDDTVPTRLAAQVAAVTQGQPLTPIAQLDTERTVVTLTDGDGTVVAEVADDVVTARRLRGSSPAPLRWREIEVEVPVAAPDLQRAAADLLSDAGARPAGHGSKLARVLTETT
ncbi:MAG TPA: CYTH domain-containing protein [Trebonia sp.]|nr:CYTH domain-containing protein [Trebonia sp.]